MDDPGYYRFYMWVFYDAVGGNSDGHQIRQIIPNPSGYAVHYGEKWGGESESADTNTKTPIKARLVISVGKTQTGVGLGILGNSRSKEFPGTLQLVQMPRGGTGFPRNSQSQEFPI